MTLEAARRAAALLGDAVESVQPLHGGDLSTVARVRLASGRAVVAKAAPSAAAEGEMLRAIAAAGAPAPEVLATAEGLVVMSDLGRDEEPRGAWQDLGRAVARLHAARGECYGWAGDHAFGRVAIPNAPTEDWPTFWAERRLRAGIDEVPVELGRRIDRLCARLANRLPACPAPALLHGDLWAGNVVAAGGRVTGLIDPACYYGHAEVDLAMLELFGSPDPAFRAGYGPAEPGREDRLPLYQLWPALVHLRLFGGGYAGLVSRLLDAAG
ncbi:aminoglycoside phosphotransferase [Rhodobacteraceae bacterium WD3A24]|nr:aminoglycoside phosphotransferase [Rhodobacteraceae bacterium WD3A24]